MAVLGTVAVEVFILVAALIGIAFAVLQWYVVARVAVISDAGGGAGGKGRGGGSGDVLEEDEEEEYGVDRLAVEARCAEIQQAISIGAMSFLLTEYKYLAVFMAAFAAVIFLFLGSARRFSARPEPCAYDPARGCRPALANAAFSAVAFLLGALTSVLSGYLGMRVATFANARTALEAHRGIDRAFAIAFRSGAVMGFLLASSALLVLYAAINLFGLYYGDDWGGLYESITDYGLGGSSVALFGRVGGGIYTKAADVGADLVGKVERNIPEDDPRNPAVIADNVGDNVGDIAGMGSDLFGSYAELLCAALFVASISSFGTEHNFAAMMYPLLVSAVGLLVCAVTTLVATDVSTVECTDEIGPILKRQILISTVLMTGGVAAVTFLALPARFTLFDFGNDKHVKNWHLFICVSAGLWAGLVIGYVTEYFTSNAYGPVRAVARSCRTGAATNVIFGLAVGYKSVIVSILAIAAAIYAGFRLAAMYGIALAALGMLSTIATGLAIDAYGPISDNAGGIAEMAGMPRRVRDRTDALDAAGNTTAAIGKGFAIGSAALVSLALFGAYESRAGIAAVDVLSPRVFVGLLAGAMLPYWFSAMTMRSVGSAALRMVEEVRRQFDAIPGLAEGLATPDYATHGGIIFNRL
ncbi:pyrophosphate-energized vacuolar membrane proton pump 1-like isoform X2 [Panicum virgatum]|uniref:pyrophosphate-energized vacuolar membrane proton pump 1-like isoform X2 n=1 Tax=Panicum virgatum TaxID=38727 RepID=UPI0019D55F02|nr:pyrophosphate-energized vacuolar membrane proton pump 1-like isoform X2 [Panicum virgatum]